MAKADVAPFAGFEHLLARTVADAERHRQRPAVNAGEAAEIAFERLEPKAEPLADATRNSRAATEANRFMLHLESFRAVDTVIGMTWAALRSLETSSPGTDGPPPAVRYATSALGTRAISTAHEMFALIRAGLGNGARARWRTLYEIDVIAAVLAMGNRGTAARYMNHRWIALSNRPHDYVGPDQPDFERHAQSQANHYIRRYGTSFRGQYGWASEITRRRMGVQKPKLYHLEKLATDYMTDHAQRVVSAHQIVHPSSVGALASVDAAGSFHAGADDSHTDDLCADLVWLLTETVTNLLWNWRRYEADGTQIETLQSVVLEVGLIEHRVAFSCARRARNAETL